MPENEKRIIFQGTKEELQSEINRRLASRGQRVNWKNSPGGYPSSEVAAILYVFPYPNLLCDYLFQTLIHTPTGEIISDKAVDWDLCETGEGVIDDWIRQNNKSNS